MMKVRLATIVVVLLALAAGMAGFVWAGLYDIAATEQHLPPTFWVLHTAMKRSVRAHSKDIQVPDLSAPERAERGLAHYRDRCVQCHGGPGVPPDPVGLGLTPAPANLVAVAREWQPSELYWVIRHGIKMTGMPAWQYRLSDHDIWDIVAFLTKLRLLSPEDYARMSARTPLLPSSGQASSPPSSPSKSTGGDADAGKRAIQQYLCVTCHRIPGITGAANDVGPTLKGIGARKYIAGVLPNNASNMVRWLRYPKEVDPLTAMPDLGLREQDARDIAAYLSTLKDPD